MADALSAFLDQPTGDAYLTLRTAVIAAPDFEPYSDGLARLEALVSEEQHDEVSEIVPELMPTWLLSPRVHLLLAHAAGERSEEARSTSERMFAEACIHGIRETGDGSKESPYRVIHAADEYDLVEFLGKEAQSQRRENDEGTALDVITCTDGSEIWFDVTESLAVAAAQA
ncbi:MAG: DUF4919 domain-containing protein [Pseudomonadota bacterium]